MTNLFLSFLEISIPVSLMIGLLLLLTPLFNKRYAAQWKYWIWIVLALRLLIPFGGMAGESPAAPRPQEELPAASGSEETAPAAPAGEAPRGRVTVALPAQMTAPVAAHPAEKGNSLSWLDLLACVWVSGSAGTICVPLASYLLYQRRLRKKGSAVQNEDVLHLLQRLKHELRICGAVSVIEYPEAFSPMLIGFLHPVVVLPKEQYHAEELLFILKHELIHLKRGDLYGKLLFEAVRAVHWWNPLVWAMQKEAAVDMELSCDARVIQDFGYVQRKAYTEALLSMLQKQSAKRIALSTNFYGGKQIMKKRFENILAKTGKKSGAAAFSCAVILAMSLGTLVGCSITPGSPAAAPGSSAAPGAPAVTSPSGANNIPAGSVQSELPLRSTSDAVPITVTFVPGMGCSDPTCTDASHHHDCPAGCADYEHHHTCALDCTEASHHHSGTASNNAGNPGNSGGLDNSGSAGNSGGSGNPGGHHNESGHHGGSHHG